LECIHVHLQNTRGPLVRHIEEQFIWPTIRQILATPQWSPVQHTQQAVDSTIHRLSLWTLVYLTICKMPYGVRDWSWLTSFRCSKLFVLPGVQMVWAFSSSLLNWEEKKWKYGEQWSSSVLKGTCTRQSTKVIATPYFPLTTSDHFLTV
jgi:hypothetical protein